MRQKAPKRAFVTGATGFIGKHLVAALRRSDWEVHVLVRPQPTSTASLFGAPIVSHVHEGSTEQLVRIVEKASPDVVFHLASLFLASHTVDDVARLVTSNVLFGCQLLEAMDANGVSRLVNTGTAWQHYDDKEYSPVCLYAATKQAFEALIQYYVEAKQLSCISLQLGDTYGPDDTRKKILPLLMKAVDRGDSLDMSPGEQYLDLVHVDDVIAAYLVAADRLLGGAEKGHQSYKVSSDSAVRLKELVRIVSAVIGKEARINWGSRPYRSREVMVPWRGGVPLPGWKSTVTLEEGVRQLADRLLS